MPAVLFKDFEDILQQMINVLVANTDLSDVTDSSTVKHLMAAAAREMDEIYYRMALTQELFSLSTAVGSDLDERVAEILPSGEARQTAKKAACDVVFARSATVGTLNIPIGTRVQTGDDIVFETTAIGTILDTFTTSGSVPVIAVDAGTIGNVAANTIIRFQTKPVGVDTVTNPAAATFGLDLESDESLRDRARNHIANNPRCTVPALSDAALQVELANGQRVVFSHTVEDIINRGEVTVYIDDGQGTADTYTEITGENVTLGLAGPPPNTAVGGEEFLYLQNKPLRLNGPTALALTSSSRGLLVQDTDFLVNEADSQIKFTPVLVAAEGVSADYTHYTGLIQETQKVIDGDVNDRENYKGWRAAGVRVVVRVPQVFIQQVEATLVLDRDFAEDAVTVQASVQAAVQDHINNLGISGDVLRNRIIEVIMSVDGVYNTTVTTPVSDVIMLDDQLARTTIANIVLT